MTWITSPHVRIAAASIEPEVGTAAHRSLRTLGVDDLVRKLVKGRCAIDVKSAFNPSALAAAGLRVWRL